MENILCLVVCAPVFFIATHVSLFLFASTEKEKRDALEEHGFWRGWVFWLCR